MSKEELQKIYEQLEAATEQLLEISEQARATSLRAQAIARVLTEIREKLASGGGPADR